VLACYRFLLGREPESEAVVERRLARGTTLAELRREILRGEEFRRANPPPPPVLLPLAPPPLAIEHAATPERLAAMLARIGAYWARIGEEAPHWSVLTQERFRPGRIAATRADFYATGETDRALVRDMLARHGLSPAALPRLVEYGCGVGRATVALAKDFARVVGCDISPAHLALARRAAAETGQGNIAWLRSTIERPMPEARCDVWYSRLVLQHNPPPVIAWLLGLAFARLAPGGVALFQVPTHREGYRFDIAAYLAEPGEPGMEMHVLPQPVVFALAEAAGLSVLEVREDTHLTGAHQADRLSCLFMLRRRP
jgi:SAM-dependent methyltransferase